jgi:hypothetical protein
VLPVKRISCEGQSHYDVWMQCPRNRWYSSMNRSDFGYPLSISKGSGSEMEAGSSSWAQVLGLYHCIVCVSGLLST